MAGLYTLSLLVGKLIKTYKFILIDTLVKKPTYVSLYTHLRYFLGGDRPSQTNNLKCLCYQIYF